LLSGALMGRGSRESGHGHGPESALKSQPGTLLPVLTADPGQASPNRRRTASCQNTPLLHPPLAGDAQAAQRRWAGEQGAGGAGTHGAG
uniref:Uncharacterized protein n=1 Tax=Bubo bubo TaxID=30461 RepID=A0A8C0EEZ8_BUBBB